MQRKCIKIFVSILASVLGLSTILGTFVYADDSICNNPNISSEIRDASGCNGGGSPTLPNVITSILNTIIGISGLVSVAFIIIGGIQYMTSSGDANKTKKAKDTIIYATIGLAICALAFAIVNWVISSVLQQ